MCTIEERMLKEPGSPWRHYVTHDNWSVERAQKSVDRMNRYAPKSREYRVAPVPTVPPVDNFPVATARQEGVHSASRS